MISCHAIMCASMSTFLAVLTLFGSACHLAGWSASSAGSNDAGVDASAAA